MKLYVNYTNWGTEQHSEEEYGDWSRTNDYNFENVSSKFGPQLFNVKFKPVKGQSLYYVWVSYDSGDSFGSESNCMMEVGLYDNLKTAEATKKIIDDDFKANPDYVFFDRELAIKIVDAEGIPINTNTYKGYFEHFNGVYIEELIFEG